MRYFRTVLLSFLIGGLCSNKIVANSDSWSKLALEDLATIKSELEANHPGSVDRENLSFAKWLDRGYIEASELARKADSFGGYYFALRRYADGFNDSHLSIKLEKKAENYDNFWPGFAVSLRNNNFVVADLSDLNLNAFKTRLPQVRDRLIACDGKSAKTLFENNILPFYGIDGLLASERISAPRLMFDEGNPFIKMPSRCTFEDRSGRYNISLNWQPISSKQKENIIYSVVRGNIPEIGLRAVQPGFFWITLSSFSGQSMKDLEEVIKTARENKERLKKSDVIVFDVRGNDGGSSSFGENLLNAIWGNDFTGKLPGGDAKATQRRASQGNLAVWKKRRSQWVKELGDNHDLMQYVDRIIVGMEAALKRGDTFDTVIVNRAKKTIGRDRVTPKIYLLSDGACKSACLDFADFVLSIPNAELIGVETSADTQYIENRAADLPSENAYLWFSMNVWRGRVRRPNQPYKPTHQWQGENWDTEALENWVLELSRSQRSPN